MARPAGFEPATIRLEGGCSIQLSYGRNNKPQKQQPYQAQKVVGVEGFEPPTLWSQTRCATKLRYTPTVFKDAAVREVRIILMPPDPVNTICNSFLIYSFKPKA